MRHESGFARRRFPLPFADGVAEVKAARRLDALVEVIEIVRQHLGDLIANTRIVGDEFVPIDAAVVWQSRLSYAGNDGHFRTQMFRRRLVPAARSMDLAHRILDRHLLRTARLHIQLRSAPSRAG